MREKLITYKANGIKAYWRGKAKNLKISCPGMKILRVQEFTDKNL